LALQIELAPKAHKDLKALDNREAAKLLESIKKLVNFPDVLNIKRLANFKPSYRFGVGDYRILFEAKNDLLVIYRVLHRRESYR
jgi:mRNA interferase RelE/StbE